MIFGGGSPSTGWRPGPPHAPIYPERNNGGTSPPCPDGARRRTGPPLRLTYREYPHRSIMNVSTEAEAGRGLSPNDLGRIGVGGVGAGVGITLGRLCSVIAQ